MEKLANKKENPHKEAAIQLFAFNHGITAQEVANKVGVSHRMIRHWRQDPEFHLAVYNCYMNEFDSKLPSILDSMVREAQAGNVQAGRLILEHSGKLVKNVNVTIDSPYEKFLKSEKAEFEVVDAEVEEIVDSIPDISVDLPERVVEDQRKRVVKEKKKIQSAKKIEERKRKRREWYKWNERAKKAGVEPLPARRPTPAQRKAWEQQIIDNEEKKKENK